ncbi:MAG TPA: hypothetical protein VHS55_09240 [Solirubrobacteraceae bacterium]|nr:hypothetical protein [Solirubrobacteraceae bacterium]
MTLTILVIVCTIGGWGLAEAVWRAPCDADGALEPEAAAARAASGLTVKAFVNGAGAAGPEAPMRRPDDRLSWARDSGWE